ALEEEENRQLHRELGELKRERTRLTNRIKGLLAGQGIRLELKRDFTERLGAAQMWDGSPVPAALRCRLLREWERVELINRQIRELEDDREELVREWESPEAEKVRRLMQLRGIGVNFAWLLVMEFFGWRRFRNRRQVGALAGLAPTPYQSGESRREGGISKAGSVWVRGVAIEMAWAWLRFQPGSALSKWYRERYASGGSRMRRIGIVAVARRLLVDLWRYLDWGVIPVGAALRA
ncbi:MAG: IS110 family transposase, partial [candidate division NC10 bacterium]|nr:IS110 family transposase [candidate division NC10 bacterium]